MYVDDNTKEVFNKAFDLVRQGVVAAADTLKTYAPQLWEMARRQTILEGYQMLGGIVITIGIAITLIRLTRRGYAELPSSEHEKWDKESANAVTTLLVVVTLIVTISLAVNASDCLLNPDYWTLKRILEMRGN